jgi:predicted metal-dependent HD superfamily phosphohydrolase
LDSSGAQRKKCVVRAAIYHDVYLLPGSNKNELFSALLATRYAPKSFSEDDNSFVEALILSTQHPHIPVLPFGGTNPMWALIDADLGGIGQTPESFAEDTKAIEREFNAAGTNPSEYAAGRKNWAQMILSERKAFLPKNRFVYFGDGLDELDAQAYENLRSL